jgi:hypothetical protein
MKKTKTKKPVDKPRMRAVKLIDKPLKEWLFHICDDRCVSFAGDRTGHRTFSGRVTIEKKTSPK